MIHCKLILMKLFDAVQRIFETRHKERTVSHAGQHVPGRAFHGFFDGINPQDQIAHLLDIDQLHQDKLGFMVKVSIRQGKWIAGTDGVSTFDLMKNNSNHH